MDVSLVEGSDYETYLRMSSYSRGNDNQPETDSNVVKFSVVDQTSMEVVDMYNNNHYMILVDAQATLQTIEPELRHLANLKEDTMIFLIFESRVISLTDYLHTIITDQNNTFYMLYKKSVMEDVSTPLEESTSRFLSYETKITGLTSELTRLKVEHMNLTKYCDQLKGLLHSHNIPLPEEREMYEKREKELEKKKEEKEEQAVLNRATMLKWTDQGPEGIQSLINEINNYQYTSLEVLDLSDLHMGDKGAILLAKLFSQGWSLVNIFQFYFSPPTLPLLHSIILYGNDIGPKGISALSSAFKYLPQIELLGLEFLNRRLSSKQVEIFNDMRLEVTLLTSITLDISNKNLVDDFLVQFCGYMDYLITDEQSTIRKLYFNNNRFRSRGVMKLASLMADGKIPKLEILNLENNEINEESTHFLSCSITDKTVPNLKEFHIGGNPIGDKGVTHLFRYFKNNKVNSITSMSLDNVQMGYEGIRFISNCVLFNTMMNLEEFNVSKNAIDSKGFVIILKSIERGGFPKLQQLDVSHNHINDDGVNYFIASLSKSQLGVLNYIDMEDNKISQEMIQTCMKILSDQDQLTVKFQSIGLYFVCFKDVRFCVVSRSYGTLT